MREGRHDGPAAGAEDAVLARHALDLADLVAHALVAHRLQRVQRVEVGGVGHAVEQRHRVARRHDAAGLAQRPSAPGGVEAQDQPPPRTPSR
jgi:hypothetical protein